MDIEYKSNPDSINKEYNKIIDNISNENKEYECIDKVVYKDEFLLVFSNEKPNALEYNTLISNIIIDSSDSNIGFITYNTEDGNRKYAAEIRENFDDPISYISIYIQKLNVDENIELDVREIYDYISDDIINRYDSNLLIACLISIVAEHNGTEIHNDSISEIVNKESAEINYCRNEIISDLEQN
jgi:hypothetical protein